MRQFDGQRWEEYVTLFVRPDFQRFGDVVKERILPVFDDITQQANEITEREFAALTANVSPDQYDGSAVYQQAMEVGYDHYAMLTSMRTATLNLYAAALYHLTEQHVIDLYFRVLDIYDREELMNAVEVEEVFEWFKTAVGFNPKTFASWQLIYELKLLANVVKHAEGGSAGRLRSMRPSLFQSPNVEAHAPRMNPTRIRKPLFGEDVYVTFEEFARYHKGSVAFWTEFAGRLSMCESFHEGEAD